MYIFLAFFLPLAYGFTTLEDSPCYDYEPAECGYDEIWCPDAPVNRCQGPGYCIAPAKNNLGGYCYPRCPLMCYPDNGKVYCPGSIDSSGCELTGYCANSYSTDCTAVCDVECDYSKGEVKCQNGYDENGCNLGAYCMAPTFDKWNNNCDAICPPVCDAAKGEVFCPGGIDSYSGCEKLGYCARPSRGDCLAVCEVQCDYNNGEIKCSNGYDENFCHLGYYCLAPTKGKFDNTCYKLCPPDCHAAYGEIF